MPESQSQKEKAPASWFIVAAETPWSCSHGGGLRPVYLVSSGACEVLTGNERSERYTTNVNTRSGTWWLS